MKQKNTTTTTTTSFLLRRRRRRRRGQTSENQEMEVCYAADVTFANYRRVICPNAFTFLWKITKWSVYIKGALYKN